MNTDKFEKIVVAAVLAACIAGAYGISRLASKPHRLVTHAVPVKKEAVVIKRLKPGNTEHAYATYRGDDGFWWYWMLNDNATGVTWNRTNTVSTPSSYPLTSGLGRMALPSGNWAKGSSKAAPDEKEVEEEAEVEVEEVSGTPLTGTAEEKAEQNPEETVEETVEETTESPSESPGESTGESAGEGSGGEGSGGGEGGGGEGGGGE